MRVTGSPWNEPSAFEFECRRTNLRLIYHSDRLRTTHVLRSDKIQKDGNVRVEMNELVNYIYELTNNRNYDTCILLNFTIHIRV